RRTVVWNGRAGDGGQTAPSPHSSQRARRGLSRASARARTAIWIANHLRPVPHFSIRSRGGRESGVDRPGCRSISRVHSASPRASCHPRADRPLRSEEHTSELQSRGHLVCRLLLEKKKNTRYSE